ncbi:hypothetical protein G9A89_021063 [Geosiphon pyriformis]|nr:hypothetical protein G9A89_021063 [Geosiphon pyriformis]
MIDATRNIRKMKITDNIYSLAQQLFQLIQHQEMEITINQQTIQYQDTRKTLQLRTPKKTENTVDKIMVKVKLAIKESTKESLYQELTKETWNWWIQQFSQNYCYFYLGQHINIQNLYTDKTKQLFDKRILQQLEHFLGKNNLSTQNKPEILLNKAMDMVTSNQLGKITNAQFEELQTQITQVILKNEIQKILQEEKLHELDFDGAQY